jgi:hypothetical protein
MNRWHLHIIVIGLCFIVGSCTDEIEQEVLVQGAVEIKIGQYRANQLGDCKEKAYLNAEDYVDSLLVAISLEKKLDTIPKSEKPSKPPKPIFKTKPDSIIVDRIYEEE